jgi:hypothetical protein
MEGRKWKGGEGAEWKGGKGGLWGFVLNLVKIWWLGDFWVVLFSK